MGDRWRRSTTIEGIAERESGPCPCPQAPRVQGRDRFEFVDEPGDGCGKGTPQ